MNGKDFPEVERLVLAEVGAIAKHGEIGGGHSRGDNITSVRGTNATYALRRLKRDYPDLAEKVVAGEMSANAAALKAGFRKKPLKCCPECGHKWR